MVITTWSPLSTFWFGVKTWGPNKYYHPFWGRPQLWEFITTQPDDRHPT